MKQQKIGHHFGFTLIEILAGLAIGGILIAAILKTLESTYENRRVQQAMTHIQFNGTHAMRTLSMALKYNGYEGCKRKGIENTGSNFGNSTSTVATQIVGSPTVQFPISDFTKESLQGFELDSSGNLLPPTANALLQTAIDNLNPQPRSNSDLIVSYNVSLEFIPLEEDQSDTTADLEISGNTLGFKNNDYAFITDCFNGLIFKVTNNPTTEIKHADFPIRFSKDAEIRRVEFNIFYVGDSGRRDAIGQPVYSLYRSQNGTVQEVAEGTPILQVEYQLETPGGATRYVPADNADLDIEKTDAMRLGLLTRSLSAPLFKTDTNAYTVLSTTFESSDLSGELANRNIKKVFISAILLRNNG